MREVTPWKHVERAMRVVLVETAILLVLTVVLVVKTFVGGCGG